MRVITTLGMSHGWPREGLAADHERCAPGVRAQDSIRAGFTITLPRAN
jgi:hypothetical protein